MSYTPTAHKCISYPLLSPNKRVWSLSFTTDVFSSQGMSLMTSSIARYVSYDNLHRKVCLLWQAPSQSMSLMTSSRPCKNNSEQLWYCQTNRKHWKTNFFHKVTSYFKTKKMYYTHCAERSVISITMLYNLHM